MCPCSALLEGDTMPLVLVLLPLYSPATHHGNPPPPAVPLIPPPPRDMPTPPPPPSFDR